MPDWFNSMYSRNDLEDIYRDVYKDIHGTEPEIPKGTNRAGLCSMLEKLEESIREMAN